MPRSFLELTLKRLCLRRIIETGGENDDQRTTTGQQHWLESRFDKASGERDQRFPDSAILAFLPIFCTFSLTNN